MKLQRHAMILRVVRDRRIESQEELREALAGEGFHVTQATLSRDIRELGLAKLADPQGGAFYANPQEGQSKPDPGQVLPALLVSIEGAENLLVVKTVIGGAEAVGAAIDQAGWSEIIGTISGVDTVLLVTRGTRQRKLVEQRLQAYAR
ncbi:MAG TPA: hypothetical protein VMJ30_00130 [Gemmatimonadales bacterium]|nr:hypothetical protein [Gemmatimonadales bacterium]